MKKILIIALCIILALSGCGGEKNKDSASSPETKAETKATEAEKTSSQETTSAAKTAPEDTPDVSGSNISIEEQVLLEQDGIKITATEFSTDEFWGPSVSLKLENNTDKNVTVQTRSSSVNGYMMDFSMSCDIAAGKKATDSFYISEESLEQAGIDTIAEMNFYFTVFDSDTWDDIFDSDYITLKTSIADSFIQSCDDSGQTVYEDGGIKIVYKNMTEDSIWGPSALFYIENNSDTNITIQCRNTSINGYMIDPMISDEIGIGKKAIVDATFSSDDLEANDITTINEIETSFYIFDSITWDTITETDPIVITVQ